MPGRGELASTSSARCNLKLASARATGCRPAWGHTTLRGTRGGALEVTRRDCDVAWVHGDRGGTGVSTRNLEGRDLRKSDGRPCVRSWLGSLRLSPAKEPASRSLAQLKSGHGKPPQKTVGQRQEGMQIP